MASGVVSQPKLDGRQVLAVFFFAVATALACQGCGPGLHEARETIDGFLDAVQTADSDALFCLMADAAGSTDLGAEPVERRESFGFWMRAQLDAYEVGRDEGWVELNGDGIVAVKLFALGKGTFFDLVRAERAGPDAMRVRMDMRFGYSALDLSGFSPGTTFYVCGVPPGRVHAIRIPRGSAEESAEVLERLSLEWTLVRGTGSDGCRQEWTIASVRPQGETASTSRITWAF